MVVGFVDLLVIEFFKVYLILKCLYSILHEYADIVFTFVDLRVIFMYSFGLVNGVNIALIP